MSHFKLELENYCKIPRKVLNLIGSYPKKNGKFNLKSMMLALSCPIYCFWTGLYSTYLGWPDIIQVSLNLCAVLCSILCGFKYLNYMFYRKQFSKLITTIEQDFWGKNENSLENEKDIIRSYGKFCYIFTTFQMLTLLLAGPVWIIEPILQMLGILPKPEHKPELILPFETWLPANLDKHKHPLFDALFSLQAVTTIGSTIILMASDTLFIFLVLNVCGQFRLLQHRLKNLTVIEKDKNRQEIYLYRCIELHQDLCEFCNDLEICVSKIILLQFFFSAGFLCVSGLIISLFSGDTYNFFRNVIFIIAALWELFVHCYTADLLTTECFQVSQAAYSSNWFESSERIKKMIIFIIVRAQQPFHLTAWNFTPASLESFEMVVRTACSYFTVFNSVKEE